jgi:hypothetical protein
MSRRAEDPTGAPFDPARPDIVRLRIRLDAVKPTVMRRIEVPVDVTLDSLHETIQAIMPWDNSHPYAFRVRDRHWGIPFPDIHDWYGPIGDARETTLGRVLSEPGLKVLVYTYDFGDDWQHSIKVERRFSAEPWEEFPRLIDARGRCPPGDVGGPWGYAEYLAAMSDPDHARRAHWLGWLGRRDPNEIDRPAMEAALRHFVRATDDRPGRGTKRA